MGRRAMPMASRSPWVLAALVILGVVCCFFSGSRAYMSTSGTSVMTINEDGSMEMTGTFRMQDVDDNMDGDDDSQPTRHTTRGKILAESLPSGTLPEGRSKQSSTKQRGVRNPKTKKKQKTDVAKKLQRKKANVVKKTKLPVAMSAAASKSTVASKSSAGATVTRKKAQTVATNQANQKIGTAIILCVGAALLIMFMCCCFHALARGRTPLEEEYAKLQEPMDGPLQ